MQNSLQAIKVYLPSLMLRREVNVLRCREWYIMARIKGRENLRVKKHAFMNPSFSLGSLRLSNTFGILYVLSHAHRLLLSQLCSYSISYYYCGTKFWKDNFPSFLKVFLPLFHLFIFPSLHFDMLQSGFTWSCIRFFCSNKQHQILIAYETKHQFLSHGTVGQPSSAVSHLNLAGLHWT